MRIRLKKGIVVLDRLCVIGQIMTTTKKYGEELIKEGKAELYEGSIPPKNKMRSNLFNPNK